MRMRCIVRMEPRVYGYRKLPHCRGWLCYRLGLSGGVWNTGRKQNGALKQCCRGESGTAMGSRWLSYVYLYVYFCIYQLHAQRALVIVLLQRKV